VVNEFPVQVSNPFDSRKLLKFLDAADADDFFAILTYPQRNRVAPVAITRKAPIFGIDQPVVEPFFLDEAGHPVCFSVFLNKLLLNVSHLDEPAVEASVN